MMSCPERESGLATRPLIKRILDFSFRSPKPSSSSKPFSPSVTLRKRYGTSTSKSRLLISPDVSSPTSAYPLVLLSKRSLRKPSSRRDCPRSIGTAIEIGLLATVVATALGTLIAMAIVRHRFVGRGATNLLVFLPMSTPEIVLGASLLTLFLNTTAIFQLGFVTIFIAHVMFIVSFVVVTVKARLIGFDRHLEEAAMDLGANELTTFRRVTLPLIAPAMLAAALLGFALSIDDFVITYFNAGGTQTFPIFVWGIARVAVPPQVNVIASAIFIVAIALALGNVLWQYRSAKRAQGAA